MKYGYTLSSEEFDASSLVRYAIMAEKMGFDFVGLSDHFHPWHKNQGESPFSWSVLGAVAQATKSIGIFVEVVCPFMRYHPAVVAQAAATVQQLSSNRFSLGLGTGEYLNEHIVGEGWPHITVRRAMLVESIYAIRQLLSGEKVSYYGDFITVEAAKLYSLPKVLPPLIISAFGPKAAEVAGRLGDGLVSTKPAKELVQTFQNSGGKGKPLYAQIDVCYDASTDKARRIAVAIWPNAGLAGQLSTELRLPEYFEQAANVLTDDQITKQIICGNDIELYKKQIDLYKQAGFTHIYLHNIGPNQEAFLRFAETKLLPALRQ